LEMSTAQRLQVLMQNPYFYTPSIGFGYFSHGMQIHDDF